MTPTDEELDQMIKDAESGLHALREERQTRDKLRAEARLPGFQEKVLQHYGPGFVVCVKTSRHDYDVYYEVDVPSGVSVEVLSQLEESLFNDTEVMDKYLTGSLFVSHRFLT